jgi:hypothetical protein
MGAVGTRETEVNVDFQIEIMPADGISGFWKSGEFGTSPLLGSTSDKPVLAGLCYVVSRRAAILFMSERLWKLGYQLLEFGFRPSSGSAGTDAALRAECQCEFGDVVPVGAIHNDQDVVFAGSEIDLLDFNSHFLRQLSRSLSSLRSVLDRTDSLVGPIQRYYERWHVILPLPVGLRTQQSR